MKLVLTGTQIYGPATKDSDVDVVVCKEDIKKVKDILDFLNIPTYTTATQTHYGCGFYFNLVGLPVNVIEAADEEELSCWAKATDALTKIAPVASKLDRVAAFRQAMKEAMEEES